MLSTLDIRNMSSLCEILGKRYAIQVLMILLEDKDLFFHEVVRKCNSNGEFCSPSTINLRLKDLESAGLVKKKVLHSRAVKYSLTPLGKKIATLVKEIDVIYENGIKSEEK